MLKVKFPKYYKRFLTPKANSDTHPFVLFYEWVLQNTCPSQSLLFEGLEMPGSNLAFQVNSVAIQDEEEQKLRNIYYVCYKRKYGDFSEKKMESSFAMESMDIGPAKIMYMSGELYPKWMRGEVIEPGYIYVNEHTMWAEKPK